MLLAGGFFAAGCASLNIFKSKISIDDVIAQKAVIDGTDNPAKRYTLLNELRDKKIVIENITVKDITESSHIDYSFCVLADLTSGGKKVECDIYSHNIKVIAKLVKGKSVINATGSFERFFSTLDDYYAKIEIIDASIKLREEK